MLADEIDKGYKERDEVKRKKKRIEIEEERKDGDGRKKI